MHIHMRQQNVNRRVARSVETCSQRTKLLGGRVPVVHLYIYVIHYMRPWKAGICRRVQIDRFNRADSTQNAESTTQSTVQKENYAESCR